MIKIKMESIDFMLKMYRVSKKYLDNFMNKDELSPGVFRILLNLMCEDTVYAYTVSDEDYQKLKELGLRPEIVSEMVDQGYKYDLKISL